jgi:hypothetical protein
VKNRIIVPLRLAKDGLRYVVLKQYRQLLIGRRHGATYANHLIANRRESREPNLAGEAFCGKSIFAFFDASNTHRYGTLWRNPPRRGS